MVLSCAFRAMVSGDVCKKGVEMVKCQSCVGALLGKFPCSCTTSRPFQVNSHLILAIALWGIEIGKVLQYIEYGGSERV